MIGVFDSGVGGLSVLMEMRRLLPGTDMVYLADRANAPYGSRSLVEVGRLAEQCTAHLLDAGAEIIVVACNTASAAALHHLRAIHPRVPFVGMEPALKPAAAMTRSGVIGVLATTATFQGELFLSLMDRFGDGLTVVPRACPGWADLVERADVDSPAAKALVGSHLDPVLGAGADTLVLGCTHYPFLVGLIQSHAWPQMAIVDPAPAVARQVAALLLNRANGHRTSEIQGTLKMQTTGNSSHMRAVVRDLTGIDLPVTSVTWPLIR